VQNQLIARLGTSDRRRLLARCETVQLRPSEVLSEPGTPMHHVYFPLQGFISMVALIDGDRGVEIGMVGNEGMLGSQIVLGVAAAPLHALVQGAGACLRVRTDVCLSELAGSPALVDVLHRYLYVQMAQMAISAGCLRFHLLGPRLARWLLMTHDRADADCFPVTQEFLAYMLGVRRAGVSTAASALQQRGLIHYRRGNFTVLDRRGLQAMACSCYAAAKQCHADVLP
jgi:CRP-like cAMP-binding protein